MQVNSKLNYKKDSYKQPNNSQIQVSEKAVSGDYAQEKSHWIL